MPLFYLLLTSFFQVPVLGWQGLFQPFLSGLLAGIGALSITLFNLSFNPFSITPLRLLGWAWIRGPGWPIFFVLSILAIRYFRNLVSYTRVREITGWMCGLGTVYLIWQALIPSPGYDTYRLFLQPFTWMGVIASTAALLDLGLQSNGLAKFWFIIAAFLVSIFISYVPILYLMLSVYWSWIMALTFALTGILFIFFQSRGIVDI